LPEKVLNNEKTILTQVAQGNEAAFRELVYASKAKLSAFAYSITQSRELAEEVVQDALIKIWIGREALSSITNFQAYLFVITRNIAINALRAAVRQRIRHQKWMGEQEEEPAGNNQHELHDLLDEAVNSLPPQQNKAWTLSRRHGMKYAEIATDMGLSKETVKRHVSLANAAITRYIVTHPQALILVLCLPEGINQLFLTMH
jgi:RNA polymerase sigma-70 factor (ECF subfamily)